VDAAGIVPGDIVTSVRGVTINGWPAMEAVFGTRPRESFPMIVKRGDQNVTVQVEFPRFVRVLPWDVNPDDIFLGLERDVHHIRMGVGTAIRWATTTTFDTMGRQIRYLCGLVLRLTVDVAREEVTTFDARAELLLVGLNAIWLGFLNLLPIPGLNGGAIVSVVAEGVRGRPLSQEARATARVLAYLLLAAVTLYAVLVRFDAFKFLRIQAP